MTAPERRRPVMDWTLVWVTGEIVERVAGAVRLAADGLSKADGWINHNYGGRAIDRAALRDAPIGLTVTVQVMRQPALAARLPVAELSPGDDEDTEVSGVPV